MQALQPDFSVLKMMSKEQAEKMQTVFFDKDTTTVAVLTTNMQPVLLEKVLKGLADKKRKYTVYYTDEVSFHQALGRYDQMELHDALQVKQEQAQVRATGESAEKVLQDVYAKRVTLDDGMFINEMIRLTFQA